MSLSNEIVLRPRFQTVLQAPAQRVLERFDQAEAPSFLIKRVDDHIFIRFREKESHFWSPQLQLEILEDSELGGEKGHCRIYGLFGPNPTLWTFFMFLHLGVATLFIIFGIWAYSSAALGHPYGGQVGAMIGMVVVWFAFYFFGRAGKAKGKPQMNALFGFFNSCIAAEVRVPEKGAAGSGKKVAAGPEQA